MFDRLVVLVFIDLCQLKGHEFAPGPALQNAVAVRAVLGVGVVFLRHFVDILELECQRALVKLLEL